MRKVFIATTLIVAVFALFTDIKLYLRYDAYDWLVTLVYTFGKGIVAGGVIALSASALRSLMLSGPLRKFLAGVLLCSVALITVIGLTLVTYQLPRGSWQLLPAAPEKLVSFERSYPFWFFGGTLFAKSETGQIYSYACEGDAGCNWKKDFLPAEEPSNQPRLNWCKQDQVQNELTPISFRPVIDRIATRLCGPDYTMDTHFILTGDGTVSIWQRMDAMGIFVFLFLALPAGLIAGITSTVFAASKSLR